MPCPFPTIVLYNPLFAISLFIAHSATCLFYRIVSIENYAHYKVFPFVIKDFLYMTAYRCRFPFIRNLMHEYLGNRNKSTIIGMQMHVHIFLRTSSSTLLHDTHITVTWLTRLTMICKISMDWAQQCLSSQLDWIIHEYNILVLNSQQHSVV